MAGLKITGVDLKREIIQVENDGEVAVSLEGIKLVDKDSKNTFAFPKGAELNAKEKLTLYCAAGEQQEDELDKLEAQEKEVGGNVFLWRTKEGNPRKRGTLNDTGELVAGKSASLGNWIKNLKVQELVEKVLKEDFQGKGSTKA